MVFSCRAAVEWAPRVWYTGWIKVLSPLCSEFYPTSVQPIVPSKNLAYHWNTLAKYKQMSIKLLDLKVEKVLLIADKTLAIFNELNHNPNSSPESNFRIVKSIGIGPGFLIPIIYCINYIGYLLSKDTRIRAFENKYYQYMYLVMDVFKTLSPRNVQLAYLF